MASSKSESFAPSRVIVTGANGFMGRRATEALLAEGHEVIAICQPGPPPVPIGRERSLSIDLATNTNLAAIFAGARYVLHLAARSGGISVQANQPLATFVHNIHVTANVLRACEDVGVERVFLASSAVVYRPLDRPLSETDPTLGLVDEPSGYAWSKICDEVQAIWRAEDLDVVIGRFTNVYGIGGSGRSTVIHDLVDRALAGSPGQVLTVWGNGNSIRSFINVADAVRAIILVTARGDRGRCYNIDTGQGIAVAELANLIRSLVDPNMQIRFDQTKPGGVPYRVLDPGLLNDLGFTATIDITEGLAALVAEGRRAAQQQ